MLRDLRLAIRRCWFRPAHTAAMVLIIGVGIGAATAVFSVVDQTILRRPPFAHAERLVDVLDLYREAGARSSNLTLEKIAGWQQQPALFEAFEGFTSRQFDLTADRGEPERLRGLVVTTGLLPMLGVRPIAGRGFGDGDGLRGGDRVALISEGLWRRRFGGRPDAVGAQVSLSDQSYTIVGVMPRRFRLTGDDEQLWVPANVKANDPEAPPRFAGIGRLAAGVTPATAQSVADTVSARMQAATPLPREPFWDIWLTRKNVSEVDDSTRTALFVLLGAVGFVLLITCANTASLFLSQVGIRQREMAVRAAIGARRAQLFREVLTESVLIALGGGALGVLLATWAVDTIVAAAPPGLTFWATSPIEVDRRILGIAALMTLATGMVFGLVPALRGSSPNVETILKAGAAGATGRTPMGRASSALVVAEVAFSLVLLVGAALMVRTFANLHALERGFDADGVIAMEVSLPTDKYTSGGVRSTFFEDVSARLRQTPGVSDVAVAAGVFGGSGIHFGTPQVEDAPAVGSGEIAVPANSVTADFFRTLRIPLVAGRTFADQDGPGAVIISASLARRLWADGQAVGKRFRLGSNFEWEQVIGVAGDVQARAFGSESAFHVYRPWARPSTVPGTPPRVRGYSRRMLIVRASDVAAAGAALPALRAAVWAVDPNQPVGAAERVTDIYADAFARERFVLQLMGVFAAIAVALTGAGIFGVLAQIVSRRTREIGVRVALGARAADIVRLVLSRAAILLAIGTALGLAGAIALSRFVGALLFGVEPLDPASFAAVTVLMATVALGACWLPTRRATRIDPSVALRID